MTFWHQTELTLPKMSRGFHLITHQVTGSMTEIAGIDVGMLHVFIAHTSASLTLNENADPDVRVDFEMAINRIVPESLPYTHTLEGSDDMPAHIKASMMGASVSVPVAAGRLCLGTWQGIYLCEHRNHSTPRRLVLTLQGRLRGEDAVEK